MSTTKKAVKKLTDLQSKIKALAVNKAKLDNAAKDKALLKEYYLQFVAWCIGIGHVKVDKAVSKLDLDTPLDWQLTAKGKLEKGALLAFYRSLFSTISEKKADYSVDPLYRVLSQTIHPNAIKFYGPVELQTKKTNKEAAAAKKAKVEKEAKSEVLKDSISNKHINCLYQTLGFLIAKLPEHKDHLATLMQSEQMNKTEIEKSKVYLKKAVDAEVAILEAKAKKEAKVNIGSLAKAV